VTAYGLRHSGTNGAVNLNGADFLGAPSRGALSQTVRATARCAR
jgi:hypothetical protein